MRRIAAGLWRRVPAAVGLIVAVAVAGHLGCDLGQSPDGMSVDRAWSEARRQDSVQTAAPADSPARARSSSHGGGEASGDAPVAAVVDGQPILRERIVELLLRGHGPSVLEQIAGLELARRVAAEQGLTVSEADIEAEFNRSLKQLGTALPPSEPEVFDRRAGEALLADILARRNISRSEYRIAMERNAYLRKIVESRLEFTEDQLRQELDRAYGERVEIRHIQLADLKETQQVIARLREGADFADLARRYSANPNTAPSGGLLRPFTRIDPDVPALMREAAFTLTDGAVSSPIRVDGWYHVLRREGTDPAEEVAFSDVRAELERRLRSRLTEPAMRELSRELHEQADIKVVDPVLREAMKEGGARRETADRGSAALSE